MTNAINQLGFNSSGIYGMSLKLLGGTLHRTCWYDALHLILEVPVSNPSRVTFFSGKEFCSLPLSLSLSLPPGEYRNGISKQNPDRFFQNHYLLRIHENFASHSMLCNVCS